MRRRLPVVVERVLGETKALQIKMGDEFFVQAHHGERTVSCRSGCSNCCYHPFLTTVSEGVLLYRWLADHGRWDDSLKKRVQEAREQTKNLGFEVWLVARIGCPLLTLSNQCAAYDARPLHCRATISIGDPKDCHPHRLGAQTPLLDNVETVVRFQRSCQQLLKRLGLRGYLMPLAEALLLGEAITTGRLDIHDSDSEHVRYAQAT